MSLATVEVRGTFHRADSTPGDPKPLAGQIEYELTTPLQDAAGNIIYEPVVVTAELDEDGHATVDLVATDATGAEPTDSRYRVTHRLYDPDTGHKYRRAPWLLEVPEASPGGFIDLADVAEAADVDLTFTYVLQTEFDTHVNGTAAENVHEGYLTNLDVPNPQTWLGLHYWKRRPFTSPGAFGAIGDGLTHPLSAFYGSLAAAQVDYPHAVALTDEIDWAAWQAACNWVVAQGWGEIRGDDGLYRMTRKLTLPDVPFGIDGAGIGVCTLRSVAPTGVAPTEPRLELVPGVKLDGVHLEGFTADGNGSAGAWRVRDVLQIDGSSALTGVHSWLVRQVMLQKGARHGGYHNRSWKGKWDRVDAYANGQDGFHAGFESAHGVTHDSVTATSNGRYGIAPGYSSEVHGHTVESNGVANVFLGGEVDDDGRGARAGVAGVVVHSGYYEGETTVFDPANPKYQVLIDAATDCVVEAGPALERRPTSIRVQNASKRIVLAGLRSADPIPEGGTDGAFAWDSTHQVGISVSADCEKITIGRHTPVPVHFENPAKVRRLMADDGYVRADLFGGDGAFPDADADGLADNWVKNVTGGTSATCSRTDDVEIVGKLQRVQSNADYNGIHHAVALAASTTYSLGVFIRCDDDVYVYTGVNTTLAGRAYSNGNRWRLAVFQFTTGAGAPPATIGLLLRHAGKTMDLNAAKLVKGAFTTEDFPLLGMHEASTAP